MTGTNPGGIDNLRVLILTPNGRDATIARALLDEAVLDSTVCADLDALCRALSEGAGAALIAEEAVSTADLRAFSAWLEAQPPWSDLPVVLLTRRAHGLERNPAALRLMNLLGNVSFVERPFHPMTLISALQAALRARRRQYEGRRHMLDRERTALALRDGAERLAFALKAGKLGAWELDVDTGALRASAQCKIIFGRPPDGSLTWRELQDIVHPEDRARMQAAVAATLADGTDYAIEYRVVRPDGSVHWVEVRGQSTANADGSRRMAGVSLDITERKQAEERQWLLTAELDHRVKNMLALIQSLVAQSKRGAVSLPTFVASVEGRIQALSRTNSLLSRSRWEGADLRGLLADELQPYAGRGITLTGPDLLLRPKAATSLGLAVHELATNAVKYGALSVSEGTVTVAWDLREDALRLRWIERGGPAVAPPRRRGFGSTLIERTLSYEVNGRVRLGYPPAGLECEIEIPLDQLLSPPTAEAPDDVRGAAAEPASAGDAGAPKRILIVEDSALVAMEVEAVIEDLGWQIVGPVNRLPQALAIAEGEALDGAVLDINLDDVEVYPVADLLRRRGIPFLFATGYDGTSVLPEPFRGSPTVQKPFSPDSLKAAVRDLVR